jgi:predicted permease
MIRHIFLISFRNFLRNKQIFVINLVGLAAGLTSVLMIYMWVNDEMSIDQFHKNKDRLYQVRRHTPLPDNAFSTHSSNSVLLPETLKKEMPEVEYVVPFRGPDEATVSVGADRIRTAGAYVDDDFFKAFSFPLILGDVNSVLSGKYNAAISAELAVKLFGSTENCIGKSMKWDAERYGDAFVISGVFEKPAQTSETFDFVMNYEIFETKNPMDVSWDSNPITVNVVLRPDVDVSAFGEKLKNLYIAKRFVNEKFNGDTMFLQKYSDIYLYNRYENAVLAGGRIDYVILFFVVAIFILLIACINFMNLSTARAQTRTREIGIKKGMGARRTSIIFQHIGESIIISAGALFLAIAVIILLLPAFNEISGKQLGLADVGKLWMSAFAIALVTGILAGSYPALYLSGFKPVEILKGKLPASRGEAFIRKGLVVFQFSISVMLTVGVVVVYRQLDYIQSRDLGYNKENVVLIRKQGELSKKLDEFLERTRQTPGVLAASSSGSSITNNTNLAWGFEWEGQKPGEEETEFSGNTVNYDYFEALGVEMKYGRAFSSQYSNEESKIIINETAMKAMNMTDPIGKWMDVYGKREIIGVIKDYHFQSLYETVKPQFFLLGSRFTNTIVVKVAGPGLLESIKALVKEFDPALTFEFTFVDDEYQALYASEQRVSRLAQYFAVVAVILSCLGLFGLAAFSAARRTKEFSIRKILGCSEWRIMRILSLEFISLVMIASLIALPLAWQYSEKWLQTFAYRSSLPLWLFVATGVLSLTIALIVVGLQAIKTARINPAVTLRAE